MIELDCAAVHRLASGAEEIAEQVAGQSDEGGDHLLGLAGGFAPGLAKRAAPGQRAFGFHGEHGRSAQGTAETQCHAGDHVETVRLDPIRDAVEFRQIRRAGICRQCRRIKWGTT